MLLQLRPHPQDSYFGRKLARLLKVLLRSFGIACIDAREVPPR